MNSPPTHSGERLNGRSIGESGVISEIEGGRALARHLLALGLRVGSEVSVLHYRSRGVVVSANSGRIALGGDIAEKSEAISDPIKAEC